MTRARVLGVLTMQTIGLIARLTISSPTPLSAQQPAAPAARLHAPTEAADSVTIRIVNTELRTAVQIMAQYLDRAVLFSGQGNVPVTLETPRPVARGDVVRMLRGLVESQSYELVTDTAAALYRVQPKEVNRSPPPAPAAAITGEARRAPGPLELFVISLKHARAADVAQTVNALYGRANPLMEASSRVPTLGAELRENLVPPVAAPLPQTVPGVAGRSATFTGDVTIVPDARANSLLVRANRNDFELIDAVVRQLDIRPLQVLIEVLIAEVRRDRSLRIGMQTTLGETSVGHNGATVKGSIGAEPVGAGLGDFVLRVMGAGGGVDLDATLRIAAERGDVRIVSRPVVLTTNNETAEIVVGSQRPFVQVARALPTDAAIRDQIVQYKDVGTRLSVRPTISTDGSVQLDVTQEVSNATSEVQFNAPVISTRSVQTQLLVHDSQTVVLGGLTDRQRDAVQGGVPLLSSIPLLGGFFGHASRQTSETELFIFLTPRIIRTDADATRLSQPMRERAEHARP